MIDREGVLRSGPTPLVEYTGVGKASVAALAAGPDGLYFSDLYEDLDFTSPIARGANVLRVRFVGPVCGDGIGPACDDGDVCTLDTCAGSSCGHEPIGFAEVDTSFGAELAGPLCGGERVVRGVEKALMKARKRIAQASEAATTRRTTRLGQAVQMLERARSRIRASRGVSAWCTASIEATLDTLRLRTECLARGPG